MEAERNAESSREEVKLIGVKLGNFVSRARICLSLKGIPYEFIEEDLQNKSALLLQLNPIYKKVPVLIHRGKAICESLVILEYIEEAWPSNPHPLLPSQPYDRALARFWASFIDDKLVSSLVKIVKSADKESHRRGAEEAKANFDLLEKALQTNFSGKRYFGGDRVGLVDVTLGSLSGAIGAAEILAGTVFIDEATTPLLKAWFWRLSETPGVKGLLPDPLVLVDYFRKKFYSQ